MSGRSRKRSRGGYNTYKYESLKPILNRAFDRATSTYKSVAPDYIDDIKNHMYETVIGTLGKNSSHTNATVIPAINTYITAKLQTYNNDERAENPANIYKRMVYEKQLERELATSKNRRGGNLSGKRRAAPWSSRASPRRGTTRRNRNRNRA
jgi:hypothetical protein